MTLIKELSLPTYFLFALIKEKTALDGLEMDEAFGVDIKDDNGFVTGIIVGTE